MADVRALPKRQLGLLLRRGVLTGAAAGFLCGADAAPQDDEAAWTAFRRLFIRPDGRVIDTGNGGVSHTEGQGWGLLFAATFGDRATFEQILSWTNRTLGRADDALYSWRYLPDAAEKVSDRNNATDGDLFIALGLCRAAARWGQPAWTAQAARIGRSVLQHLLATAGSRTVLLPGADGFRRPEGVVINPSYYAFTALDALAQAAPSPIWATLRRDGVAAVEACRFGRWRLPSDWVLAGADGQFAPAPGFAPRYGYDAVRVPLYLVWAGIGSPVLADIAAWWRHADPPPAWVDVETGATAEYPAGPGMREAAALAIGDAPAPPAISDTMDYYSAALCLLSRVAARDISANRTPAGPR